MPSSKPDRVELRPQAGPQERFARCSADVAVYGGSAGGGKSWALEFEPTYHLANPHFGAVIFRRTCPEITNTGGLWDESVKLYPLFGGVPKLNELKWTFPSGATVAFRHMQHESDVLKWHSAQIPLICFDELTTFTEYQFAYMMSRNRSTCGVRPYIRGTCNPDAASWVARWVAWFVDPSTGYPIPERAGRCRWFVRDNDTLRWANDPAALRCDYPEAGTPLSFTFIPATLDDNKILTATDPRYRAALMALPRVERERLLRGNWLITSAEGEWPAEYFGRHLYAAADPDRAKRACCVIAWDPSKGTDSQWGDYSAFVVLVRDEDGALWCDAVARQNWHAEEAIDTGLELCRIWRPDGFVIESNQFQSLLKPLVKSRAKELGQMLPPLYLIDNRVRKETRIRRLGPYLAERSIRFKGDSTGTRLLAEQLMQFPNGDHDDLPDALEMAMRTMIKLTNDKVDERQQQQRQQSRRR